MNVIVTACGLVVAYVLLSLLRAIFFPRKPPAPLEYKPRQVGDLTLLELSKYNGRDPMRPLLLAVRGRVFDVTTGRAFYGPGAGYHLFAGREVARALAKVAVEEEECTDNLEGLSKAELESLADWERTFESKYEVVGRVSATGGGASRGAHKSLHSQDSCACCEFPCCLLHCCIAPRMLRDTIPNPIYQADAASRPRGGRRGDEKPSR
ncbi:hypothetical protein CHLNCDRAFT_34937 [Chlorella variabilis]|uniref:Cytochrome b5 heme-binding domain-containing protein n=1 Tax=Chlorella variabilis TaxID=554065 RepID=E1ZAU2_CHLVA|nr:hypothetical protein CHLNCDRAFT_34937 [Chlorella variabilis]EFN57115.1 hypothetical protein CHLNCDRAFT_34937 [Chlorella variabilis]|eukprot:XP_005849217.1 hypothetical protein CHLNCDRAFT_34937 [Chlorella variabilis]